MCFHLGVQSRHVGYELRQRFGVAFGQLLDAPGERLADAIQFSLHADRQRGQPFVIHHQCLVLSLSKLGVFGGNLSSWRLLRVFFVAAEGYKNQPR